jgi:hypothetical protein
MTNKKVLGGSIRIVLVLAERLADENQRTIRLILLEGRMGA